MRILPSLVPATGWVLTLLLAAGPAMRQIKDIFEFIRPGAASIIPDSLRRCGVRAEGMTLAANDSQ